MDVLASLLPFGAVLGVLAMGLIVVRRRGAETELRFVRVRARRRRQG